MYLRNVNNLGKFFNKLIIMKINLDAKKNICAFSLKVACPLYNAEKNNVKQNADKNNVKQI